MRFDSQWHLHKNTRMHTSNGTLQLRSSVNSAQKNNSNSGSLGERKKSKMIKSVDVILIVALSVLPHIIRFSLCWHFQYSLLSHSISSRFCFYFFFQCCRCCRWSDFTVLLTLGLRVIFGMFIMDFFLLFFSLFLSTLRTHVPLKRRKRKKTRKKLC